MARLIGAAEYTDCSGLRPAQRVSWFWHEPIWWWGSSNAGALGNAVYPFIAISPWSTPAQSGSTC